MEDPDTDGIWGNEYHYEYDWGTRDVYHHDLACSKGNMIVAYKPDGKYKNGQILKATITY